MLVLKEPFNNTREEYLYEKSIDEAGLRGNDGIAAGRLHGAIEPG